MVFGRGQKPAEFPLLRKVPLTSAVSEISFGNFRVGTEYGVGKEWYFIIR